MFDRNLIAPVLERALASGADFAELFLEDREDSSLDWFGAPGAVARIRTCGAGLYLIAGTRAVYVCLSDPTLPGLLEMASRAAALLSLSGTGKKPLPELHERPQGADPCPVRILPGTVPLERKAALLRETEAAARAACPALRSIRLTCFDRDQRVLIANSEGLLTADRRVTARLRFIPVVSTGAGTVSYFSDYCAPAGFEAFEGGAHLVRLRAVLRDMEGELTAREAPSARVPVILEGGSCAGTFFHEACGHQLETTALRPGAQFWDRRGTQIASPLVTLVDDGTMPSMYGSSRIDDEGMPRRKNVLIENGVLRAFLADRLGALRLGVPRSGSGRRQDYAHAPGARMSNTYLAPGTDDDDAILRDTEEGLFVTGMGGGTGGREFTLLAATAYWVKHGEIACRVKGAMLVGRGEETMKKIDRVGRAFRREESGGSFCGADSGFCATTTSGPRLRIAEMVVGGKGGSL